MVLQDRVTRCRARSARGQLRSAARNVVQPFLDTYRLNDALGCKVRCRALVREPAIVEVTRTSTAFVQLSVKPQVFFWCGFSDDCKPECEVNSARRFRKRTLDVAGWQEKITCAIWWCRKVGLTL
jgi:hypothetical protein